LTTALAFIGIVVLEIVDLFGGEKGTMTSAMARLPSAFALLSLPPLLSLLRFVF
jgi:hypothetical protein